MAAAAQVAFARVRTMNKTSIATVDTIDACHQTINSLVPFLAGLDALGGTGDEGPNPAVVDHVFDVLAQIGHDQARGEGLFARPDLRPEAPFIATLKSPAFSDAYAGRANLDKLADAGKMISSIHSLTELLTADKPAKATGDLFSVVANDRIKDIRKNKSPDHELVGIYEKVRDEFIALCGDRRVGEYRRKDLQHYVNEISWLPPEASSEKDFSYKDVAHHIQQNKLAGGRGLAAKTIRDGRLSYIRALIGLGCEDAGIRNPIAKSKVKIPDRAPLGVARIAPDGKAFERVWRAGIASGVLSDALLPPLALLAGRRVGVLATLWREDIKEQHGVYFFEVRSHDYRNGRWEPLPFKTAASLEIIIIPQVLVDAGFVEWARKESGPLFPALMACKDPADAAQKRMNRLIKDNTEEDQLAWVFHALRHGKIDNDRDNQVDRRLIMKQVGHESGDVHDAYGRLTPKQMRAIASASPPEDVDWSLLKSIDFERFSKAKAWRRRKGETPRGHRTRRAND
jgi:integrase